MEKTVHLKRGTKSLGKHSEFEALVQVKQTVHHAETTARSKFQKKRENQSLTLLGAARQPASLFDKNHRLWVGDVTSLGGSIKRNTKLLRCSWTDNERICMGWKDEESQSHKTINTK